MFFLSDHQTVAISIAVIRHVHVTFMYIQPKCDGYTYHSCVIAISPPFTSISCINFQKFNTQSSSTKNAFDNNYLTDN